MADHSQKWHDGTTSRNIGSSSRMDGLAALVNKNNGGRQTLAKTVKKYIEEASLRLEKQDKWLKTFCHNLEKSQNHHSEIIQGLKSRVTNLAKEAVTKIDNSEDCKAIFTNDGAPLYTPFYYSPKEIKYFLANSGFSNDDELNNVTSIPDEDLKHTSPKQTTTHYVEPCIPQIPFPRRLKQHVEEALIHKTMESLKKIKLNRPFLKEIRQSDEYPKFMKDPVANKPLTMENEDIRINRRCSALLLNQLPPKEKDPRSFILPCSIGRLDFNNALADLGASISIMPFSMYKRLDEEEYNKRRYRLLGMPYIAPLPLIIEQVEITRYSLGPGEVYTKVKVLNMEELTQTRNNIATIRRDIMDEVYESYVDDLVCMLLTLFCRIQKLRGSSRDRLDSYSFGNFAEIAAEALTRLNSSTWATKWFKRLVAYAKCNRDSYESELGTITINRGLIQAIPTSLPPQPIGEATKASNLRRIPPGVQGRSHFTYFLYLIVQITNPQTSWDEAEREISPDEVLGKEEE
ncbi:hypothetical protein Tco_0378250 [Tanacetum coccineum]